MAWVAAGGVVALSVSEEPGRPGQRHTLLPLRPWLAFLHTHGQDQTQLLSTCKLELDVSLFCGVPARRSVTS